MTIVSFMLGGRWDLGSARNNLIFYAAEGFKLYDVVPEQSKTLYLGPFPVIVKIEGKDLRTKNGVKGWAGWIPGSEVEESKFQELVLCPSGDRTEIL